MGIFKSLQADFRAKCRCLRAYQLHEAKQRAHEGYRHMAAEWYLWEAKQRRRRLCGACGFVHDVEINCIEFCKGVGHSPPPKSSDERDGGGGAGYRHCAAGSGSWDNAVRAIEDG